jgi:hypothetical protein
MCRLDHLDDVSDAGDMMVEMNVHLGAVSGKNHPLMRVDQSRF